MIELGKIESNELDAVIARSDYPLSARAARKLRNVMDRVRSDILPGASSGRHLRNAVEKLPLLPPDVDMLATKALAEIEQHLLELKRMKIGTNDREKVDRIVAEAADAMSVSSAIQGALDTIAQFEVLAHSEKHEAYVERARL